MLWYSCWQSATCCTLHSTATQRQARQGASQGSDRSPVQVRFSRHLLLSASQLAVMLVASATTGDFAWRDAIPVNLRQVVGVALLPTAGLYFMEAAARRSFIGSRVAQPVS